MTARKIKKAANRVSKAEAAIATESARHRDTAPIAALSMLSEVGDQPQLRTISGGFIAAGLLARRAAFLRAGIRMLVAHELATIFKNFVKARVDRTRPRAASNKKQSKARLGKRTAKAHTSFPSGHTAGAVAVAQAFAREFPEHATAARAAAGAVGLAQIPRCAHYPTDVGAGAVIGVVAEAGVAKLWRTIERALPDAPTPEERQPPPLRA
jgi:membrane-associated phospholipid phosphatase